MRLFILPGFLACAILAVPISGRAAGDACRPLAALQPQDKIVLDVPGRGAAPRLEAALARDVTVKVDPALLGLEAKPGEQELSDRRDIPGHIFGYGDLVGNRGQLTFEGDKSGQVVVRSGTRYFVLRFQDGVPKAADGQDLAITPPLFKETRFTVPARSTVRAGGVGEVILIRGTKIAWTAVAGQPLELGVSQPLRLEETVSGSPVQSLKVVRPERVPQGGSIDVQVSVPNFDLRTRPPVFCFLPIAKGATSQPVASPRAKFVGQSGDVATFTVQVPDFDEAARARGQAGSSGFDFGMMDRALGIPATVRAVGIDGQSVVVDVSDRMMISSTRFAGVLSGLLLVLLYVLTAPFLKEWNPLRIIGLLIKHESGSYSLSNLQILMWTVLVIYALCFNWISTGELLNISAGILVLLGISGTTSVLARTMEAQSGKPAPTAPAKGGSFKDLVASDEGRFDLLRFQMLGFTLFTWSYVLVSVMRSQGFPEIPENFYALMGISSTAYVGGKIPDALAGKSRTDATPVSASDLVPTETERSFTEADLKKLQAALGVRETGVIDQALRDAVKEFKLKHGVAPANGRLDKLLIEKILGAKP